MAIESFRIKNYKSFHVTELINLSDGFNLVVGANNVGKTALLECIGLAFGDKPHRSLETIPNPDTPYERAARVDVEFKLSSDEFRRILSGIERFIVPSRKEEGPPQTKDRFLSYLSTEQILQCALLNGSFSQASLKTEGSTDMRGVQFTYDLGKREFVASDEITGVNARDRFYHLALANQIKESIYYFRAERLNISRSAVQNTAVLLPNASNLPTVLNVLQGNASRFRRFNEYVKHVLPDIKQVSVLPTGGNEAQILIWPCDPNLEREDLAIPLSECGTGVGQILSILYVVTTSAYPRTIVIDEPQSFLHPGAIHKLFEILKEHKQHQYIISTHSPTVVTSTNPKTVLLLRKKDAKTQIERLSMADTSELRQFLIEIGASLADVFGADRILWVEGRTEEFCFRKIFEKHQIKHSGVEIISVTNVGDIEGRHTRAIIDIYRRLCHGRGLLPPALAFVFDREGRSQKAREEIIEESDGLVQFIPRRMYENFILHANAIANIINMVDAGKSADVTPKEIKAWIDKNGMKEKYYKQVQGAEWIRDVDAAQLLVDLFNEITSTRVHFEKMNHGLKLTEWILENSPSDFDELVAFLRKVLGN